MASPGHRAPRRSTITSAKRKKSKSKAASELAEDDEEDGWMDYDAGDDDGLQELLGLDDESPGISTGDVGWGEAGLKAAEKVLSTPEMDGIELYLFRIVIPSKQLVIRLDKLSDKYGSPSIDDIAKFSRMMFDELEALLGTDEAGDVSFEVSSPGAERQLILPDDLQRFQDMALSVEYQSGEGEEVKQVLQLAEYDPPSALTTWKLAEVKANSPGKGRTMSKKQRELRVDIPVDKLLRVRIHVDF